MAEAAQPTGSEGSTQPPRSEKPVKATVTPVQNAGAVVAPAGGGFFTIYKKGQGYWTRIGTVAGAALIAVLTAQFIYSRLRIHTSLAPKTVFLIVTAFLAVFALVTFRIVNKPSVVDFLIATDSEMKKVNWTTRAELIGSTKVVIIFMLLIMFLLFVFDIVFGFIFGPHVLHILETSW